MCEWMSEDNLQESIPPPVTRVPLAPVSAFCLFRISFVLEDWSRVEPPSIVTWKMNLKALGTLAVEMEGGLPVGGFSHLDLRSSVLMCCMLPLFEAGFLVTRLQCLTWNKGRLCWTYAGGWQVQEPRKRTAACQGCTPSVCKGRCTAFVCYREDRQPCGWVPPWWHSK